jgi:uncharacterized coiled-coil protein SlyX
VREPDVITVDERLAFLEGRVTEHSQTLAGLPGAFASFEERLEVRLDEHGLRFDQVDARFDRVDARLGRVEARLDRVETRLDLLETRLSGVEARLDRMDNRLDRTETQLDGLRTEMSMNFRWIVGIQLTTFMTIVAALVALR